MLILLDCDEVLLNMISPFSSFLQEKTGMDFYDPKLYPGEWEFFKNDIEKFKGYVDEFQHTSYFRTLPPIDGATQAIKNLKERGHKLIIVSAASSEQKVIEARLKNLEVVFGKNVFEDAFFVPFMASKKDVLKSFSPTFFIEDSVKNALTAHEMGHQVILLRYPFNESRIQKKIGDNSKIQVVQNWEKATHLMMNGLIPNEIIQKRTKERED